MTDIVSITTYVVVDSWRRLPEVMAARDRGAGRSSRRQHAGHGAGAGPTGVEDGDRRRRRSLAAARDAASYAHG